MADSVGKKASRIAIWILLALLIVGLAGFGVGSFGGRATTVGSVGDQDITAQEYFRALNQAVRARQRETGQALTLAEAQAQGLIEQVQGQLATAAALDGAADRMGLSVGDDTVARQLVSQQAFQGLDGEFDREAYEFALRQNGWTVPEFEAEVRDETARGILQAAVTGGVPAPERLVDLVAAHFGERRTLSWVRFGADDLDAPLPEPTRADLRAFHQENAADYTLPERRRITYAWLTPEMLAPGIELDEATLRALYDERIEEFVRPERRLVERLVFPDRAAAERAREAISAGETSFPELVAGRDLTLSDVDLGEVTARDLGAAGPDVFAAEEPGVVGPVETDLGPALFRVNAILAPSEVPFAEARAELGREMALDRARRRIEDMIGDLDDRLAAGATVEDLAEETPLELGTVEFWEGAEAPIADYAGFREAAAALSEDDFPEIRTLQDGGVYAMRLDAVLPPELQPLDSLRDRVAADWRAAERRTRLTAAAEAGLEAGAPLESAGSVETAEDVRRDAFLGGTPPVLVRRAFAMAPGETAVVAGPDAAYLLRLDAIAAADPQDPDLAQLRQAFGQSARQGLSNDVLQLYARAVMAGTGISFDEAALNAVHSQIFR